MWHHFWDVAVARDAVIQGDLEQARQPLLRMADDKAQEDLPQDWLPWVGEMRDEARKAATAKTLKQMADVVTAVSEQCAECHRTTRGGPVINVESLDYGHPKDRNLSETMERHAWAADELWVGMTVPSSPSWSRGALALAEFPLPETGSAAAQNGGTETGVSAREQNTGASSRTGQTEIAPALSEKLAAVRALGKRANEARQPFEQTAVFSELIVLCGGCHLSLPKDAPPFSELER
jgi:hypothetical protein